MKHGCLSRVTVGVGLVPHVEPSFFWFTEIEITQDDAQSVGIRRPMRSDETQSFTETSQGKLRLEMDVNDHGIFPHRLYVHNMVTALACNHVSQKHPQAEDPCGCKWPNLLHSRFQEMKYQKNSYRGANT